MSLFTVTALSLVRRGTAIRIGLVVFSLH